MDTDFFTADGAEDTDSNVEDRRMGILPVSDSWDHLKMETGATAVLRI